MRKRKDQGKLGMQFAFEEGTKEETGFVILKYVYFCNSVFKKLKRAGKCTW